MALTPSDITFLDTFKDIDNKAVYTTTTSVSYTSGDEYIIWIVGESVVDLQGVNALGVPVTTGMTWIQFAQNFYGRVGMRGYRGSCSSTGSRTTEITFPADQKNCNATIINIANVDEIINLTYNAVVTTKSGTVTIPTVTAGNAAVALFGAESSGVWSADSGETAISDTVERVNIFGSYNLSENEIMGATYVDEGSNPSDYVLAIGFEMEYLDTGAITITSVNGGSSIADGDLAVEIVGTNFVTGNNTVLLGLNPTVDATVVSQTITTDGSPTSLEFTVDLPTDAVQGENVYLFVDSGVEVSAEFAVTVTPAVTPTLLTVLVEESDPTVSVNDGSLVVGERYEIEAVGTSDFTTVGASANTIGVRFRATGTNGGGNGTVLELDPVICESVDNDFASGITAWIMRAGSTKEDATEVTAVTTVPSSTIQFHATFPNGDPVLGDSDEVVIAYTQNGNIRSVTGGRELATSEFTGETCT